MTSGEIMAALEQQPTRFSAEEFLRLRAPLVYVWMRHGTVLYVGMSANGIERPFDCNHHRLKNLAPGDEIIIWPQPSREAAVTTERDLIQSLRPPYNGGPEWQHRKGPNRDLMKRSKDCLHLRDGKTWYTDFYYRRERYTFNLGQGLDWAEARQLAQKKSEEVRAGKILPASRRRHAQNGDTRPQRPSIRLLSAATVSSRPPRRSMASRSHVLVLAGRRPQQVYRRRPGVLS